MACLQKYHLAILLKMFLQALFLVINTSASENTPFCKSVYLMCNSSSTVPEFDSPTCPGLSKTKNFFKKSDIFVGGQILPANLQNEDSLEALLPSDFTEQYSTKPETARALSEILSSSSSSPLTQYMQGSVCGCGVTDRVELKICPTSVAGMVELATLEPGSHHLDILDTKARLVELPEKEMMVTNVALRRSPSMKTSIVCKEISVTAGKVSMCYAVEGVENIEATMQGGDGEEEITVGMQCYKEEVEEKGEGERWCHWVNGDTLVGVVKAEEEEEGGEEEEGTGSEWMEGMKMSMHDMAEKVEEKAGNLKASLEVKVDKVSDTVKDKGSEVKQAVEDKAGNLENEMKDTGSEVKQAVEDKAGNLENKVKDTGSEVKQAVGEKATNVEASLKVNVDKVENKVKVDAEKVKVDAEKVKEAAKEAANSPLGTALIQTAANQTAAFIQGIPANGVKASLANAAANAAGAGVKLAINALPVP